MRVRQSFLWLGLVGAAAVLIVAAVLLSVVIAPNRFKWKIEDAVTNATGHRLELAGDVSIGVSRWLSLTSREGLWLASGIKSSEPLAQWRSATVRVRILPLFKGRIVLDTIRAEGLHLFVRRDHAGALNWHREGTRQGSAGARSRMRNLDVGGFNVSNSTIDYRDDRLNVRAHADALTLHISKWIAGAEVNVRGALHATVGRASEPPSAADLRGDIRFASRVQLAKNLAQLAFHSSTLSAHLAGAGLSVPGIELSADLPRLSAVIEPLSIEVPTYTLTLDEARASGSLALGQNGPQWSARGPIQLYAPSARKVLLDLGLDAPMPRDAELFGPLTLEGTWELNAGALTVEPFMMQIDSTRFDGRIARSGGNDPRLSFELRADRMDLGAYADLTRSKPAPFELPVAFLRALNADGEIVVERARLLDSQLRRVTLRVESHE